MRYHHLSHSKYEFRLLHILPSIDRYGPYAADIVRCRLVHTSLSRAPPYHALSYSWGDTSQLSTIVLDDEKTSVRTNLDLALRELRRRDIELIWVDAVCINQGDHAERGEQVLRMGDIYYQADTVIAWLGPSGEHSDLAIDVLSGRREGGGHSWQSISALLGRPFWSRAWIIQELCKARKLQILCGSISAEWSSVLADVGVTRLVSTFSPTKDEAWDHMMRQFKAQEDHKNELLRALQLFRARELRSHYLSRMPLLEALLLSRRSLASDPRDKVYALLSLASDGYDLVPTPNYDEPMEMVYTDVARNTISIRGLTATMLLARRPPEGEERLPSWVPDWRHIENTLPPWIEACLAVSCAPLRLARTPSWEQIQLRGKVLETITAAAAAGGALYRSTAKRYACNSSNHERGPSARTGIGRVLHSVSRAVTSEHTAEDVLMRLCRALLLETEMPRSAQRWYPKALAFADRFGEPSHRTPLLQAWLLHNWELQIGHRDLAEWIADWSSSVASYLSDFMSSHHELLHEIRQHLEDSLHDVRTHSMRVAVTKSGRFFVVYQEAEVGDKICRLENCNVPVVLRRTQDGYRYVGEVLLRGLQKATKRNDMSSYWTKASGWPAEKVAVGPYDFLNLT